MLLSANITYAASKASGNGVIILHDSVCTLWHQGTHACGTTCTDIHKCLHTYVHTHVGTVNDIMRTYVALINNNLSNRTTFSVMCTLEWNESDTQHALDNMALDKTLVCDGHGTKMENSVELMISYTMHRHTYGCTYERTQLSKILLSVQ